MKNKNGWPTTLRSERLVYNKKHKKLGFQFSGDDEDGRFTIEGVASQNEDEFFMAPLLDLKYTGFNEGGEHEKISVRINWIHLFKKKKSDDKHTSCRVSGILIDTDANSYDFIGTLKPKT